MQPDPAAPHAGAATMTPMLEMRGITKRFPGVLANDNVDMTLRKGEILALLGENGAGKSTLMKILSGVIPEYEGAVRLRGRRAFRESRGGLDHRAGARCDPLRGHGGPRARRAPVVAWGRPTRRASRTPSRSCAASTTASA